jgi:hypothetical protein
VKTLFKLACCLTPFACFAQNPGYSTYYLDVNVPEKVLQIVPKENIESAFAIRGLQKTTVSPSLIVTFNADTLNIKEVGVKEYKEVSKDKDAAATTTYYVEALYTLRCEIKCYDAQKELLYSAVFGTDQSKYITNHMATRKEADDYWNNNKETLRESFVSSIVTPAVIAMGSRLNASFGSR